MALAQVADPKANQYMLINGLGAAATGITVVVVLFAKFLDGAWITVLLIPMLIGVMVAIKSHFRSVAAEITETAPLSTASINQPLVVVPVDRWKKISAKGLRFAIGLSTGVRAVRVLFDENPDGLAEAWTRLVEEPVRDSGRPVPQLVCINSPFRNVIVPIVEYVLELSAQNPKRDITVLVPELVEHKWYHYILHNQRAQGLKALLLLKGNRRITTMNIPRYLEG